MEPDDSLALGWRPHSLHLRWSSCRRGRLRGERVGFLQECGPTPVRSTWAAHMGLGGLQIKTKQTNKQTKDMSVEVGGWNQKELGQEWRETMIKIHCRYV